MRKDRSKSVDAAELSRQAEARLGAGQSPKPPPRSPEDNQRLVHELQVHQIELEMQNDELRQSRSEVEAGLERFTDFYDVAPVGYLALDREGTIRQANLTGASLLGMERTRLPGKRLSVFVAEADRSIVNAFLQKVLAGQTRESCEVALERNPPLYVRIEATAAMVGGREGYECRCVIVDITGWKQAEAYREMGLEVLQILNEPEDLRNSIQRVLAVLTTQTGFDAVGIRLQDGDDFPYFAQQGFSKDFLRTENALLARAVDGGLCRDKDGNIRLECTCGLVISGKTDPSNPLFTRGGSFWTNDSFPLLQLPPAQDPRLHPRNQCIHQGYASVALVPIRSKDRIVGLIQLNDRRKGCFTRATVEILEDIASHLGVALLRKQAEEAIHFQKMLLESQNEASIDGILNVDENGRTIWFNRRFVEMWAIPEEVVQSRSDEAAMKAVLDKLVHPQAFADRIAHLYAHRDLKSRDEILLKDGRVFDRYSAPVMSTEGSILGRIWLFRDITEQKLAEKALREGKQHFEALAEHNRRLVMELDHRVLNNLAGLLGLVSITQAQSKDVDAFAAAIKSRLTAMVHIHRILSEAQWGPVDLHHLVDSTREAIVSLLPHANEVAMKGAPLGLPAELIMPLTMILVEWFTNSGKYGAHAVPGGKLEIVWQSCVDSPNCLCRLTWTERGGPPINRSVIPSLGMELVQSFATRELRGRCRMSFPVGGAEHVLEFPQGQVGCSARLLQPVERDLNFAGVG